MQSLIYPEPINGVLQSGWVRDGVRVNRTSERRFREQRALANRKRALVVAEEFGRDRSNPAQMPTRNRKAPRASGLEVRTGFPLKKLRAFERNVLCALECVASDAAQYLYPRTDEENVRRTWTLTFATLGAEASDAATRLADAGNLRMVMLLVRSLYEYSNKATYYANRLGEAREDARRGWTFRERMLEVALSDFLPTVEPLSVETKVKTTPVSNVIDAVAARATANGVDSGQRFRRHYHDGFYAYASAIAHGGPGAINDVVRFGPQDGERRTQEWLRRRPDTLRVIAHAQVAFQSWLLLYTLVSLSPTTHDVDVDALLKRWKAFDAPLLAFKERYIAEVGFAQAALDCLGT